VNKLFKAAVFGLVALGFNAASVASERGTIDDATAMVKKAKAYIKANGHEKAYAEISNPKGQFVDRDIYIFVFDKKGNTLAHGGNPKLVGKNLYDLKDVDGLYSTRALLDTAQKGGGKTNIKFLNPANKQVEAKTAYTEMVDDVMIGSGAYSGK
jgi:cytochrome c